MEKQSQLIIYTDEPKTMELKDFAVLGSDGQCSIYIQHESIADRHARIEKKDGVYYLKDLRSPEGTFLNGTRISEGILTDGDLIRIGDIDIRFIENRNQEIKEFPVRSKNLIWNQELQALSNVALTEFPVLLLGPSGTGKDVLAQALHNSSLRKNGPFVSVNCSALTETLVESELFGHIKGSFTGAINDRKGAFEAARGGTLFLDEIGDLTYGLQAKLLRALENDEIRPVGSDRHTTTDVRIIAATHQNLKDKIRLGQFRLDLFYRLNVLQVTPPALEHRMEDFEGLLYTFARQMKVKFSFLAMQKMKKHKWPGNIRELKNFVARASALYPKQQITEEHVDRLIDRSSEAVDQLMHESRNTMPVIKEIEKQMIVQRLVANKGNQRQTAVDLGMPKSTLHDRLKYYSIDPRQFKNLD